MLVNVKTDESNLTRILKISKRKQANHLYGMLYVFERC